MSIPSISPSVCTVSHPFSGQGRVGEMGERDPVGKIRQNEPRVGAVKMPPAKARGLMLLYSRARAMMVPSVTLWAVSGWLCIPDPGLREASVGK